MFSEVVLGVEGLRDDIISERRRPRSQTARLTFCILTRSRQAITYDRHSKPQSEEGHAKRRVARTAPQEQLVHKTEFAKRKRRGNRRRERKEAQGARNTTTPTSTDSKTTDMMRERTEETTTAMCRPYIRWREADRVSRPRSGTRRSRPGYNGIGAQLVELAIAPGSLARQIQRSAKLLASLAHC